MYKMSEKPLITEVQIKERIDVLADEICQNYDFDIILSALTGAYMFTADLCRALAKRDPNPEKQIRFIKASSYGSSTESSGKISVSGLEKINVNGLKILLVDDILDTGRTMCTLCKQLISMGAKEVKSCVLLDKAARRAVDYEADFAGFKIENKFVVGYGLDYDEQYRTFPEIWTLNEA